MRKLLSITFCLVLLSIGFSPNSLAATDGCPDTWTIDYAAESNARLIGEYPSQELRKAQQKYGPSMIMNISDIAITKYEGELGQVSKKENLHSLFDVESGRFIPAWSSLRYLYGKSQLKFTIKVELKDCKNFGFFTFNQQVPTGGVGANYSNGNLNVLKVEASQWAKESPQFFIDFKKQENFARCLDDATEKILSYTKRLSSSNKKDYVSTYPLGESSATDSCSLFITGGSASIRIYPQLLTPDCLRFEKDEEGQFFFPAMNVDMECKFAWSASYFKPLNSAPNVGKMANDLIMFDRFFSIKYTKVISKTTITCIKGKLTKKVTAVNPKCPTGYKKK